MSFEIEGGLEALQAERRLRSLVQFIPSVSPQYSAPHHLDPLLKRFELAVEGVPQRVCCSAPPRHGKTESVLHVPAFALRRHPELTFSYSTYADALSRSKSRKARRIAEGCGVPLIGRVNEWRTPQGGGLLSGGVGGPLTGHGVNVAIVDDPYKNRVQAESAAYRSMLSDWARDVLLTRVEPGGSVFIFATRWHPDDLFGEFVKEGFEAINLPALDADGVALWPERWSAEAMERRREEVGEYTWASLYQGQPRSRGGRVFNDVHTYTQLPIVYRGAVGLDVSYSARTSSDWTVAVRMLYAAGKFYVVDMQRWQLQPSLGAPRLKDWADRHPTDPWRWYASGTEQGSAGFLRTSVPQLQALPAVGDKFVRSINYAAAWNAGRVLLPENAPWLASFVEEHMAFTGVKDTHDDVIDACVACFDLLESSPATDTSKMTAPAKETSRLRTSRM